MMNQTAPVKIAYQVYPRSFADSNGDGVGDIKGIISKLDYLASLSLDAVWVSPVFCSPMVDNGYDVSDYRAISPEFGTMDDLRLLIDEAKKRGMGIFLDLVLNHTSDQHKWFQQALSDPTSPYRDYYVFRKGVNGGAPNNWRSNFGGSAWELDEATGEYYLHVFAKEQPDLNWENPALRKELFSMIRDYLEMGVAGFRVDAISYIKKDQNFPSLTPDAADGLADAEPCWLVHPGIELFLAEMRDQAFAPYGAYTVAEAYGVPLDRLGEFIGENGYFSAVFDFSYTDIDLADGNWHTLHEIDPQELRKAIFDSQRAVCSAGHGAVYLENHDQNRSSNKYLPLENMGFVGKSMLGVMYFFLQGTAYIYQGQELGQPNYPWSGIDEFDDVATKDQYQRAVKAGFSEAQALAIVSHRSRDNARTPMMWTDEKNAGFTTGTPWLPVHPEYKALNAQTQSGDESSLLAFYQQMARLRQSEYGELFYTGSFEPRFEEEENIFAYARALDGTKVLVVCNFQNKAAALTLAKSSVLLGNLRAAGETIEGQCAMKPYEAMVLRLED